MRDVVILLLVTAFFAVSAAYVSWCGRIIGPDPTDPEVLALIGEHTTDRTLGVLGDPGVNVLELNHALDAGG